MTRAQLDPVRDLRARRAAIAATPIVITFFEPSDDGYRLAGRLGDLDVRAWMMDGVVEMRLYDDDWVHYACVSDTAWCSAARAVRLLIRAVRRCGSQRPTDVAYPHRGYL